MHLRTAARTFLLMGLGILSSMRADAQDSNDVKTELFDLITEYRASWTEGYVDAELTGILGPDARSTKVKVWWDHERMRREHSTDGKPPKTLIYTREWSGEFSDHVSRRTGRPFAKINPPTNDTEPGWVGYRVLPNESWLTPLSHGCTPLEEWLVTRPVDPLFVKTPTGFAGIYADANDEAACKSALRAGQPIDSVHLSFRCMIIMFNSDGLPTSLKYYGEIPETPLRLSWEWSDEQPPTLKRARRARSRDSGKTYLTEFDLVVRESSRTLPKDRSLFSPPE